MNHPIRFTQLSAPRQALVRLFQSINFGCVEDLEIRRGDPVFKPTPMVLVEVKLDAANEPRPELNLADFELRTEVVRLLEQFDALGDGSIDRIEVRHGVPRRIIIERPIEGVRR